MLCYRCVKEIGTNELQRHGLHERCFNDWFGLQAIVDFTDLAAKAGTGPKDEPISFTRINTSFFHGKFKKYSAELGEQSYILKVKEHDYPELPAVEYLCNQIARQLKLEVPDFYFIRFHGEDTFVTKNFVKKEQKENLIHIYRFLTPHSEFTCKQLISVIEKETQRLKDVERFVELCLFDALIGNHDRHGRNIAILESAGKKTLSPFYDNPSYIGIETDALLEANHSPKGAIATTDSNEPTIKHYVSEFRILGYENVIKSFHSKIQPETIKNQIANSFLSGKRKQAMSKIIVERIEEFTNETGT